MTCPSGCTATMKPSQAPSGDDRRPWKRGRACRPLISEPSYPLVLDNWISSRMMMFNRSKSPLCHQCPWYTDGTERPVCILHRDSVRSGANDKSKSQDFNGTSADILFKEKIRLHNHLLPCCNQCQRRATISSCSSERDRRCKVSGVSWSRMYDHNV